jgi:hypothetical protein
VGCDAKRRVGEHRTQPRCDFASTVAWRERDQRLVFDAAARLNQARAANVVGRDVDARPKRYRSYGKPGVTQHGITEREVHAADLDLLAERDGEHVWQRWIDPCAAAIAQACERRRIARPRAFEDYSTGKWESSVDRAHFDQTRVTGRGDHRVQSDEF